ERRRRHGDERDALVGWSEQHVELEPRQRRRPRVIAAKPADGATGVEQAGVEEVRAQAAGLQLELAEAQHAELEAEANEIGLVHVRTLYCAAMRIITLNANGIRS